MGAIGAALLLAAVISLLAVPRLLAELIRLPGKAAMELVEGGSRPSDAGLMRAIDSQTGALAVMPQPGSHMSVAYLSIALSKSAQFAGGAQEEELRTVGRYHLERALTLAPGQPRGWFMLAGLRLDSQDTMDASAALRLSFLADPHVPALAPFRWPMALILGKLLDRETRENANLEFLALFRTEPAAALRQALRLDRFYELSALAGESGADEALLAKTVAQLNIQGN